MQYCFLNSVYTNENDDSLFYEVVFSNKSYTEIRLKRVDVQELRALAVDEEYVTDFSFEDCYLKCASVDRYVIDEKIRESIKAKEDIRDYVFKGSKPSIYDLLRCGARHSFYVIADELALTESATFSTVEGITPFTKIKFSQSSLSVFVREVYSSEIKNHYLVQELDGALKFMPFYFLVPANCQEEIKAQYKCTKKINNVEYKVFYAEDFGVAEPVTIISQALLNKAACMRVVYDGMLRAVDALQKQYYESSGRPKWVDNSTHRHSIKTVSFEPSYKKLDASAIRSLIDMALSMKDKYSSLDEGLQYAKELGLDRVRKAALCGLFNVLVSSKNVTDLVANCHYAMNTYASHLFYNGMYLHRMQVFVSATQIQIVSLLDPSLCGSNENGITTVRRVVL